MLSVDCFVFSYSCCTLAYSRFSRLTPGRADRRTAALFLAPLSAGSPGFVLGPLYSACGSLLVAIQLVASPPETVRCSLLFSVFAHLAIKRFKSICPPHLCPLFSVRRHIYKTIKVCIIRLEQDNSTKLCVVSQQC